MANDNTKITDGLGEFYKAAAEVGAAIAKPVDCNDCPTVAEAQGRFERSEDQLVACREQVSLFEGERTQAEANAARLFQDLADTRTKLFACRERIAFLEKQGEQAEAEAIRLSETIAGTFESCEMYDRMGTEQRLTMWEQWSNELCQRHLEVPVVGTRGPAKRVAVARLLGSLAGEVKEWRAWAGGIFAAHNVSIESPTAEQLQVQIGEIMGGLVESYQEQLAEAESQRDEAIARTERAESALQFLQQTKDRAVEGIKQHAEASARANVAREEWHRYAIAWSEWAHGLCEKLSFRIPDSTLGDSLMRDYLTGYVQALSHLENLSHEWKKTAFDWYDWASAIMLANGLATSVEMVGATEMRKRIGEYVPFLKQQLMRGDGWNAESTQWSDWAHATLVERDRVPEGADCSGEFGRDSIVRLIEGLESDLTASEEYGASESARADAADEQSSHEKAARLYALDATARSLYRVVSVLQAAQSGPEDINSMTVKDLVTRLARKLVGIDAAVREISLLIALIHPETETSGIEAIFAAAPPDQEIPGPCPELRTEPSNEPPGLWSLDDATLQAMGEEETKPGMAPSIEEPDFEETRIGIGPEELPLLPDDLLEADDEPEHQPKIHHRPPGLKSNNCESAQLNPLSVLDDRTDSDEPGAQAGGQDYGTAEHHRAPFWGTLPGSAPIDSKELGNETPSTREGRDLIMRSFGAQSETEPETAVISTGFFGCCQNKAIPVESETAGCAFSADQAFRVPGECSTCFEVWGNYCDCECQGKASSGAMCVWGWVAGCQETGQVSSHQQGCSPAYRLAELVRARLVCAGGVL